MTAEQPEQRACAEHGVMMGAKVERCLFGEREDRVDRNAGTSKAKPCRPAVLVPVTQRQAEQDAMKQALEALRDLRAFEQRHAAYEGVGFLVLHVREWADRAIAALDAVQGIPVDTEAGNGSPTAVLAKPVLIRRKVAVGFKCPMCGELIERYTDTTGYDPDDIRRVRYAERRFDPCGCIDGYDVPVIEGDSDGE